MKRFGYLLLVCIMIISCSGCSGNEFQQITSGYQIYYINTDENNIVAAGYKAKSDNTKDMIEEFLQKLDTPKGSIVYKAAKPGEVELIKYNLKDQMLSLQFDSNYLEMSNTTEILMRMAYVKTLVQIPGVDYVDFYVGDAPLLDSNGEVVGAMNDDTFIESNGGQINQYEEAELILYFANEKGNKLKQTMKKIVYDQNIPLEKVVIEQLLQGPGEDEDLYPTIPEKTALLSINVQDGVCYVNFDSEFLKLENEVTEKVQIYSVVNSLIELPTISKVQIAIDGVSDRNFVDKISFNTVFERNLDIIDSGEGEDKD